MGFCPSSASMISVDLLFNKGNASYGRKFGTYWKTKLIHKPTTQGKPLFINIMVPSLPVSVFSLCIHVNVLIEI